MFFVGGMMERKNIIFPVSENEHAKIKQLAAQERCSIKQLFLNMLDERYPNWKEEKKENSPKQDRHPA